MKTTKTMITVQTKWAGVCGEKVRMPSGNEYQCSKDGEMDVLEMDARDLCSSSGWRRKPQKSIGRKQPLNAGVGAQVPPMDTCEDTESKEAKTC